MLDLVLTISSQPLGLCKLGRTVRWGSTEPQFKALSRFSEQFRTLLPYFQDFQNLSYSSSNFGYVQNFGRSQSSLCCVTSIQGTTIGTISHFRNFPTFCTLFLTNPILGFRKFPSYQPWFTGQWVFNLQALQVTQNLSQIATVEVGFLRTWTSIYGTAVVLYFLSGIFRTVFRTLLPPPGIFGTNFRTLLPLKNFPNHVLAFPQSLFYTLETELFTFGRNLNFQRPVLFHRKLGHKTTTHKEPFVIWFKRTLGIFRIASLVQTVNLDSRDSWFWV